MTIVTIVCWTNILRQSKVALHSKQPVQAHGRTFLLFAQPHFSSLAASCFTACLGHYCELVVAVLQLHAHTFLVKKFSPCLLQESPGLMALGSPTCLSATWTCCNFDCQGPTNVLFVAKRRFDCKRECSDVDLLCKQHIGGITLLSRLLLDQTQLYGRYMTSAILECLHFLAGLFVGFGGFFNKSDGPRPPMASPKAQWRRSNSLF